jgi:cytochrome c oxidase subunit 2
MKKLAFFAFLFVFHLACILGCKHSSATPDERINVVMKKYTFDPAVIRVKSGDVVELNVTTADVQHGFEISQLGIKEAVHPGRPTTITFTAPAKGEYAVDCSIICGPHHDDMAAKLVVE